MKLRLLLAAVALCAASIIGTLLFLLFSASVPQQEKAAPDQGRQVGLAAPIAGMPSGGVTTLATLARTAMLLATIDAPGRDLPALTQRLKLHGKVSIPAVVNARQPNYSVGTRQQFYVADVTKRTYFKVPSTLKVVTPHAYWYVKDGYDVDAAALQASADHFENNIYPTDRRVFGSEAQPGVDNDVHLSILIAPIPGVGGYFSTADTYPRVINPFSNERDMIYMASVPESPSGAPSNYFEGTLAHEFQHMIEWNVHRDRDVWLDEGNSEIAMYINGYNPGGVDTAFALNPDTQLNAWDDPTRNSNHYGASYLFLRYLMDRYGGDNAISQIVKGKGLGVDAIDRVVKAAGNPSGFEGAFKDWVIANILNDPSIAGGRYSYSEGGRVQAAKRVNKYPASQSGTAHQYAATYISIAGDLLKSTVTFKGSNTVPVLGADAHSGTSYWYSNRRDSGDASLTRELDLTRTRHATLQFSTWYDIERLFDFSYVEASTDGGANWNLLNGKYTTTDNPNGTSFGPGWTGKSGVGANQDADARWVDESIDLSAYAGRKVQVRFEYVTDEGYNRPGMAIDDIRVPEIGFSDNAESDNGWSAAGFVRVGSRMPQRWYVALVQKGSPNVVREMTVNANGVGTLDLATLGGNTGIREAILVVVPLAPKTTETATYAVTIQKK
ncbi:MAG: immune inhibitor A [Chloroflexota bacterium]|nr:immune inhibitor A [Chloroflexota bacterium]